jgi:eukaryotic-like serine/threonine-protein kinase
LASIGSMRVREALTAAIRRDPDLIPKLTDTLRERIEGNGGRMSTVVQAAEAIEPILADAVRKRPSRLGKLGLRSAELLASLTMEDDRSNKRLTKLAGGSTVGIVFVDIAGFTNFTERVGDEEAIRVLSLVSEIVDRSLRSAEGECVKGLGDGYLLAFPSASQAIRGALKLSESAEKAKADGAIPVHLRIAVHAGEPLVEQDDLLGHDVNLTARLLDHCKPGQVLVSEAAKELAERRLKKAEFVNRRRLKIRGLTSRVIAYNAVQRKEERQPPKS